MSGSEPPAKKQTAKTITGTLCLLRGTTFEDLKNNDRDRKSIEDRHIYMYLLHTDAGLRGSDIQVILDDEHFSRSYYGIRRMKEQLETNSRLKFIIKVIRLNYWRFES